jgi:hypothetical protein
MDDQEEENSHNLAHSSDLEIPDCPFVNFRKPTVAGGGKDSQRKDAGLPMAGANTGRPIEFAE